MQWGGDGGTRAHTTAIFSFHILTRAHSAAVGRAGQRLAPNIKDISIILSENIYIYINTHICIYIHKKEVVDIIKQIRWLY
jgi:hypothetical protein